MKIKAPHKLNIKQWIEVGQIDTPIEVTQFRWMRETRTGESNAERCTREGQWRPHMGRQLK